MSRYLFGPVSKQFAEQNLSQKHQAGNCLVFDVASDADLILSPRDTWESFCAKLPAGWQPEFIALYLQYRTIPCWLGSAPVPVVALAGDWNLQWHSYRLQAPFYDLLLADTLGAELMARQGLTHVRRAILFGGETPPQESPGTQNPRDIDILFVGNFHPAVQRERLPWLARLARLGERWKVVLATNVFGEDYRNLLARSRIVFNRGIRGEWNLGVGEVLASGALLFQEADNREIPLHLKDHQECVFYTFDNLETLLHHYLENEDERRAIAQAGQARVPELTFARFWQDALHVIDQEWDQITERSKHRPVPDETDLLLARVWQTYPTAVGADPRLEEELGRFLQAQPQAAVFHNALGYLLGMAGPPENAQKLPLAIQAFQKAWSVDGKHVLAGLNLAEAFLTVGKREDAIRQAQSTLDKLEHFPDLNLSNMEGGYYPAEFDFFRVEWEKAAWEHAGAAQEEVEAKRTLLRWRLHMLLAELTDDLTHFEKAALARPDLPVSQAAWGCALGRRRRFAEAAEPLGNAVASNPFDLKAAKALFQVLKETGKDQEQEQFKKERRLLAQACPQLVPVENWFSETPSVARQRTFHTVSQEEFRQAFGAVDTGRATCGFTIPSDTQAVLTLLAHARAKRILEIGTAAGHMTANFTEWSLDDAQVFSLGIIEDLGIATLPAQRPEDPPRAGFGRYANHFGKVHKVFFITADSLHYDFQRLAPLDFAFIDGAHDFQHVLSDSLKAYQVLNPGGFLVWHDFNSRSAWVEVRQALEQLPFPEAIYHVAGTEVAFLRKQGAAAVTDFRQIDRPVSISAPNQKRTGPLAIVWEGDQKVMHSLALVNREGA